LPDSLKDDNALPNLVMELISPPQSPQHSVSTLFNFAWGHYHELGGVAAFLEAHPEATVRETGIHAIQPPNIGVLRQFHFHASPDGLVDTPNGNMVLEIKSKVPFYFADGQFRLLGPNVAVPPLAVRAHHFAQVAVLRQICLYYSVVLQMMT
jgi:hypothetical protein